MSLAGRPSGRTGIGVSDVACEFRTRETPQSEPGSLEKEVMEMRTENGAIREQLRKLEEQQKAMLQLMNELQRKLDGGPAAIAQQSPPAPQPAPPAQAVAPPQPAAPTAQPAALDTPPTITDSASTTLPPASGGVYKDGIVIWETREDAKVPFLLKFNDNTQFRYLNTLDGQTTFTDHLGVVHDVHLRNDFTVNRSMFIFGGYIFDKRLLYSLTVWTSAGAASIIIAGNIGWRFGKALTITGGYTGLPGSRSLVNTFPFFTASDRSMADNFFRPGFTQGTLGERRTLEGVELFDDDRQWSQYLEYLGSQRSMRIWPFPAASGGKGSLARTLRGLR